VRKRRRQAARDQEREEQARLRWRIWSGKGGRRK
jgi:hypothetical protein